MNAIKSTLKTPSPQREAEPGLVKNNAGGYVYAITPAQRLRRFLVLGTDGGTYYQSERNITKENIDVVKSLADNDPQVVYDAIVWATSVAPRNEASLFALAVLASGSPEARQFAKAAFPQVVRTGTHLFHFLSYLKLLSVRGWGRGLRNMVASYFGGDANNVALHAVKYRQRDGWSQRDALRLSHAKPLTPAHREVFNFVTGKPVGEAAPAVLQDFITVQGDVSEAKVLEIVKAGRLPWEGLRDEHKTKAVWSALLPCLPIGALVRQLATLTRLGVFDNKTNVSIAVGKLTDAKQVKGSRIHPVQLTDALMIYKSGGRYGMSKGAPYTANVKIVAALETAIDLAFNELEPTGKRLLVAIDCSSSMWNFRVGGSQLLTPAIGAAIMATQHSYEPNVQFGFFSTSYEPFKNPDFTNVSAANATMQSANWGETDCAAPMLYAQAHKLAVDAFIVYTDNETWCGKMKPMRALSNYRKASGIPAKLIVCAMTATQFSIADPKDGGALDVVGLASDTPAIITSFIKGW